MERYIIQTALSVLSQYLKYKIMISLIWLIHSTSDLTHIVKAKGTAVSVHAMKEYRGADIELYTFLSLSVDRCELSASYVRSGVTDTVSPEYYHYHVFSILEIHHGGYRICHKIETSIVQNESQ